MISDRLPTRRRDFVPIAQCAWCGGINVLGHHVRIPGIGKFTRPLTIGIPVVAEVSLAVTHGICPSCAEKVFQSAKSK